MDGPKMNIHTHQNDAFIIPVQSKAVDTFKYACTPDIKHSKLKKLTYLEHISKFCHPKHKTKNKNSILNSWFP